MLRQRKKVTCEQKQKGKNVSRRSRRAAVRAVVVCLRQAQEALCRGAGRPGQIGAKACGTGARGAGRGGLKGLTGLSARQRATRPHRERNFQMANTGPGLETGR